MSEELDLGKKFEEEYRKIQETIKKPNILLAGATGVGKSSLINMIFGKDLADVGIGKPVTQQIDMYESDKIDVRLFDSKGYELGEAADQEFYNSVVKLAKDTKTPEEAIHIIWYCIDCGGHKVTDYDLQAIGTFMKTEIPIAIVLTKADLVNDEEVAKIRNALPASADSFTFETTIMPDAQEYNQLEKLIAWSIDHLDESLRVGFIKSQKVSLGAKWKKAHSMIKQHTAIAFGVGFVPMKIADAPLLVANETALLGRILYIYDLSSLEKTLGKTTIGSYISSLISKGGKALVNALLNVLPGGWVVKGVISGSVAAAITNALGEATSCVSYKVTKLKLEGKDSQVAEMLSKFGPLILEYAKKYLAEGRKDIDEYSEDNM